MSYEIIYQVCDLKNNLDAHESLYIGLESIMYVTDWRRILLIESIKKYVCFVGKMMMRIEKTFFQEIGRG